MTRQATVHEPQDSPNARLRQVRAFIEQVEPAQFDLMQMLLGALRGRMVLGALIGLLLAILFAAGIFFTTKPVFQSQGLMRIVARESKILYANSDDSRLRLFDAFVAAEVTYLTQPAGAGPDASQPAGFKHQARLAARGRRHRQGGRTSPARRASSPFRARAAPARPRPRS